MILQKHGFGFNLRLFESFSPRLFGNIFVNKLPNALHIAFGFENIVEICDLVICVISTDILAEAERLIYSYVVAKIIRLSHRTLTSDGAICHQRGNIARKHIRMITVLDDEGVLAVALRAAGDAVNTVHNAVNESAPVCYDHAFIGEGGIIIVNCGQIGAKRRISVATKVCKTNDLNVGVCILEELDYVIEVIGNRARLSVATAGGNENVIVITILQLILVTCTATRARCVSARRAEEIGKSVTAEGPVGDVYIHAVCLAKLIENTPVILSFRLRHNRRRNVHYGSAVINV